MRLDCSQIPTRSSQQLRTAPVAKRVRVQLAHTDPLPDRFHELPDAVICHPAFAPSAALCAISDDEQWIVFAGVGSLVLHVVVDDLQSDFWQREATFITAFALNPRETEVAGKVTDIQAHDLRPSEAAVRHQRENRLLPSIRRMFDDLLNRRPPRNSRNARPALWSREEVERVLP